MRLLSALLFFLSLTAEASEVSSVLCSRENKSTQKCQVQLKGMVRAGDKLQILEAEDADELFFQGKKIGAMGFFPHHIFSVKPLPRLYSLNELDGQSDPVLQWESHSWFSSSANPRFDMKVVPDGYPLRRVYRSAFFQFVFFLSFGIASLLSIHFLRRNTVDGWLYPKEEIRWFLGALSSFLFLSSDWSKLCSPIFWSPAMHESAKFVSLAITVWSLTRLLHGVRFNDRSCLERGLSRKPSHQLLVASDLTFLVAVFSHLAIPRELVLIPQLLPLGWAIFLAFGALEWKRILKRSGVWPFFFHLSLMAFSASVLFSAPFLSFGFLPVLTTFGQLTIGFALWRELQYRKARKKGQYLAKECRSLLSQMPKGSARLQAFCEFVEDEWSAARMSVIAVIKDQGLMLASAGPDAISISSEDRARKLGPFLRRVCKAGHILYAPVAEELGKDLQSQGLKHSSLAIPLIQKNETCAVLCMMAEEGERISPWDASVLEQLVENLSLEILSAVRQQMAEEKCERLLAIAKRADGIAVEHMDPWGHIHYSGKEEERYLVGAKIEPLSYFAQETPLAKVQLEFQRELRQLWIALAASFEFLPKENKDDLWLISPREFQQEFLQKIGPAASAILLISLMDKKAKQLLTKDCYLLLAQPMVKIAAGRVNLEWRSFDGQRGAGAMDVSYADHEAIHRVRERSSGDHPYFLGKTENFSALELQFLPRGKEGEKEFHSILCATADKREMRKLEQLAAQRCKSSGKAA